MEHTMKYKQIFAIYLCSYFVQLIADDLFD